jgi:hypothetical protein
VSSLASVGVVAGCTAQCCRWSAFSGEDDRTERPNHHADFDEDSINFYFSIGMFVRYTQWVCTFSQHVRTQKTNPSGDNSEYRTSVATSYLPRADLNEHFCVLMCP